MFEPTFWYHPTEAPLGRKFTDEAECVGLGPEWVDTPTKFPAPDPVSVTEPDLTAPTPKKGRKAKELS